MWTFNYYDTVGSTNDVAREAGLSGCQGRTGFVAAVQTGGRGRRQRAWSSPPGGLWMSLLLRPQIEPEKWPLTTLSSGIAVASAVAAAGVPASLKWPNDVQIHGKKAAGILCESSFAEHGGTKGFVVVGIGLNLNVDLALLPDELRTSATSLLFETGHAHDCRLMAESIAAHLDETQALLEQGRESELLDMYRALCPMLGKRVSVITHQTEYEGVAQDIAPDGALMVERYWHDGRRTVERVVAADVSVRLR